MNQSINKYGLYAIGEILLVMIGILLALQVNNWNEARKQRLQEKELIGQIHQEFLLNQEELAEVISRNDKYLQTIREGIGLFPINPNSISRDTLHHYFDSNKLYEVSTFNASSAVVDNVLQNNLIDLIHDKTLRQLILEWKPLMADYLEEENKMVLFTNDMLIPYLIEKGVYKRQGFLDVRTDLSFLSTPHFENLVYRRRDLFRRNYDRQLLREAIEQIVALSSNE